METTTVAKMRTTEIATGKYRVYLGIDPVPGMVLGGHGKWLAERGGKQFVDSFPTLKKAAARLVTYYLTGE